MSPRIWGCAALAAWATASSAYAQALDNRPTWYIQAGQGEESSKALVVGTTMPWKTGPWQLGNGLVHGHWDAWLGAWSNRDLQDHRFTTPALGIGPSLRWRGAQGNAPWFLEAGTALMVTGKRLYNDQQRMGTRFNFATHLGVGLNFGPNAAHALTLRVQHASNAGIRNPNPGINFVQLRYAHTF